MARPIEVIITANARKYQSELRKATGTTQKFGAIAKTALIGGAVTGLYALGKAARIGWDEYNEGAKVAAQTNAVLKSTGGVANVTAKEVYDLANALHLKTTFDDEAIQAGENMLLTFRNIRNEAGKGNDIFTQATKVTLDFAQAMGMDATSAALAVGKALNDPAKGLTRLTRMGVTFSDQQVELITRLQESGRTMDAQKVILRELQKEYGGSAEAAGKTFGGQLTILKNRLDDFLGDLTAKAIPQLQKFVHWIEPKATSAMKTAREITKTWQQQINAITKVLHEHEAEVHRVTQAVGVLVKVIGIVVKIQLFWARVIGKVWVTEIRIALAVIHAVTVAVRWLGDNMQTVGRIGAIAFRGLVGPIMALIGPISTVVGWVQSAVGWLKALFNTATQTGGALGAAASAAAQVPHRAMGGLVPGPIGAPRLILAHGGEMVTRRDRLASGRGAGSVNVIVLGGDREAIDYLRSLDVRSARRSGRGILG